MFKGNITALVTPFTEQGDIDLEAFDRLVDFQLQQGSDGLVIAGTTGESTALLEDEFTALLGRAVERIDGRLPVIAGTGGAATGRTIGQTLLAAELGVDLTRQKVLTREFLAYCLGCREKLSLQL